MMIAFFFPPWSCSQFPSLFFSFLPSGVQSTNARRLVAGSRSRTDEQPTYLNSMHACIPTNLGELSYPPDGPTYLPTVPDGASACPCPSACRSTLCPS
ncbi:hypothetical protein HDK64DRAFT_28883 [Phyllosticta capitalensis]|uniref:Secreted protein n=1 Tax=Phyllosticta capitalensis TaxID=121624 RepID=A0ABR1YWY5_9PEZI